MKKSCLLGSMVLLIAFPLLFESSSPPAHGQQLRPQGLKVKRLIPSDPGRHKFGAIAFSQSSGRWGTAYNYKSRAEAEQRALAECRAGDCAIKLWFRNACGALATGKGNCAGWAWAGSRAEAERKALEWCRRNGKNCSVRCWACTDR